MKYEIKIKELEGMRFDPDEFADFICWLQTHDIKLLTIKTVYYGQIAEIEYYHESYELECYDLILIVPGIIRTKKARFPEESEWEIKPRIIIANSDMQRLLFNRED